MSACFRGPLLANIVQIRGDGNIIQIEVFGYERPDANDEYDANWLRARCSVTVAEFSAVLSLALVTHDFARFTDELEQAVQLLKGTATFSTVEAGLAIEIKFTTAGHAEVFGSARSQTSDRKSTRLNSSHQIISYAVFCLIIKRHHP